MLCMEIDAGGIALVTINMEGRAMNVCDWSVADRIAHLANELRKDARISGVILTSGKKEFIAGADIAILDEMTGPGVTPAEAAHILARIGNAFRQIETIGKPVVVASPGTALGAGLELMLACHYRIGARNDQALFGLPEVGLGILPGAGGTQRLPRLIGLEAALPLLVTGKPVSAARAHELGLLDELVETEDLIPAAHRALTEGRVPNAAPWDRKGFRAPGHSIDSIAAFELFTFANAALAVAPGPAYPAPRIILSCVWEGSRLPIDAALKIERQWFGRLATSPETSAMIELRFHTRQRAAKAGLRKPQLDDPVAQVCQAAIQHEAARLRAEGWSTNRINTAALSFDIKPNPLDPGATRNADVATSDDLRPLARRLLLAGALAVAETDPPDPDIADIIAVEAGGFPAWTGGPLALIDHEGAECVIAEASAAGFTVPCAFRHRLVSGVRFRPKKAVS